MSDLVLVLAVAGITFTTRVAFLLKPGSAPEGFVGRFLDVFPLALFVAIATDALAAPGGSVTASPGLAAAAGGVIGGAVFRRALWGVLGVGAAVFYVVRGVWG
jgi:hypothetical protein